MRIITEQTEKIKISRGNDFTIFKIGEELFKIKNNLFEEIKKEALLSDEIKFFINDGEIVGVQLISLNLGVINEYGKLKV